jgi:type VI secretion system secreted protein VgrG
MPTYTQTERLLTVSSPLGEDVLLMTEFTGREEISRLFTYQLDLLSENDAIAPGDLVGRPITWGVNHLEGEPRYFHGYVSRFAAAGASDRGFRSYRADVVPWLWFLTRTTDCKIFQHKSADKILRAVFDSFGFADFEFKLTRPLPVREYCVQYRETAFNFVSRLMEEEGIFYFFKHENGKHTLVLADAKTAYVDCAQDRVEYYDDTLSPNHIYAWEHQYEYRTGRWTQTDYNFETPTTNLGTSQDTVINLRAVANYEKFDYPGLYLKSADGKALTKLRMEEEETPYDVVAGASTCCGFTPASKFRLTRHECEAEKKTYVLTGVQHFATDPSYHMNGEANGHASEATAAYRNTFTCIPATVPFRPARVTPKPVVHGLQTAVVVGPKGEEIYTDKYGRIKVQFFWDRQGKRDENSSVWMRVAQILAGKRWGAAFWPRIGHEVVVDFLEGDPDRPLITGSVYNAQQMPPYDLPANQTQSGIKTRSSKDGKEDNFNELRFEDKKGKEEIVIHAERDLNESVEHDQNIVVFHNRSLTVGGGKDNSDPKKDGTLTQTIEGDVYMGIQKGDYTHEVQKGKTSTTSQQGMALQSQQKDVSIKAKTQIKLEVGSSSLLMKEDGTIELKGVKITIDGSSSVTVQPAEITLNGSAVKINGKTIDSVASGVNNIKGGPIKLNC